MVELSHPDILLFHFACQEPNGLTNPQREGQKGTFLAWKRSRLEVNYQQRQILLSFSWVRKIKATLIPGLSPQPSNSWECYQLICLSFVVSPSLALQIRDTSSTPSGEKPGAFTMCPPCAKNVASLHCSSQETSIIHSSTTAAPAVAPALPLPARLWQGIKSETASTSQGINVNKELRVGIRAGNSVRWDNREPASGGVSEYNTYLHICKASVLPRLTPHFGP